VGGSLIENGLWYKGGCGDPRSRPEILLSRHEQSTSVSGETPLVNARTGPKGGNEKKSANRRSHRQGVAYVVLESTTSARSRKKMNKKSESNTQRADLTSSRQQEGRKRSRPWQRPRLRAIRCRTDLSFVPSGKLLNHIPESGSPSGSVSRHLQTRCHLPYLTSGVYGAVGAEKRGNLKKKTHLSCVSRTHRCNLSALLKNSSSQIRVILVENANKKQNLP